MTRRISKKTLWRSIATWGVLLASIFAVLIVGVLIFVKVNATAAASIADNVLRPVIGTNRVIALEQAMFNLSDKASQLKYKFYNPSAPQFLDQNASGTLSKLPSSLNLAPIPVNASFKALKNEGQWTNLYTNIVPDQEVMAYAFVRPDPSRSYAIASIVQIDTAHLRIGAVAGTKEPGGSLGNAGTGMIPEAVLSSSAVVAAFNGGFLYVDGNYGMMVGNTTYVPLKNNVATVVEHDDGTVNIVSYTGQSLGKNVAFARQNGPLLIDNGVIVALNDSSSHEANAKVLHGGAYTWRSGLGVTQEGNVVYVAGNGLSPKTLAAALQMAGAVSAMQLDINPSQVRFDSFSKNASGGYDATPLNRALAYLSDKNQYIKGYTRDFFYVYKK